MTAPAWCVFCKIVAGEAPANIVAEWPSAIAFVPLNPVVDGHVLVIPRKHVRDAAEDPVQAGMTMFRAADWAGRHESANIITSMGRAATQSIDHLHLHVVPRTFDDGLMTPWGTIYGDEPSAPHWCRVAANLQQQVKYFAHRSDQDLIDAWEKSFDIPPDDDDLDEALEAKGYPAGTGAMIDRMWQRKRNAIGCTTPIDQDCDKEHPHA